MDKYRKSAEEIMRRGDAIIAERKRHSAIYKLTAFAVSGLCAAIIAGVGIWNNPQLKNLTDRTPPTEQYIADTTETTVYSENKADTTTTAEEKAVVTAAATDVKVTSRPTAVVTDKQTEKPANTKTSPASANSSVTRTAVPTSVVTAVNTTVVTAEIRPQTTIPYITTAFSVCVTTVKPVNTTSSTGIHTTPGLQVVTKPVTTTLPPPSGGVLESPTTPETPEIPVVPQAEIIFNEGKPERIRYQGSYYVTNGLTVDSIDKNAIRSEEMLYVDGKLCAEFIVLKSFYSEYKEALALKMLGQDDYTIFIPESYSSIILSDKKKYDRIEREISPDLVSELTVSDSITHTLTDLGIDIIRKLEIYTLKDISPDALIAVKYEGQKNYMLYYYPEYDPKNLGEFVDDINLWKTINFSTTAYCYEYTDRSHTTKYDSLNGEIIKNILLSNTEADHYLNNEIFPQKELIKIRVDMPGYISRSPYFVIYENGYIRTNLLYYGHYFNIGENKTTELLTYITENGQYIPNPPNENSGGGSVVETANQ